MKITEVSVLLSLQLVLLLLGASCSSTDKASSRPHANDYADSHKHVHRRLQTKEDQDGYVSDPKDFHVTVVFFAYLDRDKPWKELLKQYAEETLKTGLLERANRIHICMSTKNNNDWYTGFYTDQFPNQNSEGIHRLREGLDLFNAYYGKYAEKLTYDVTLGNLFEYPGILRVWENAQAHPDDASAKRGLTMYYHSKGMTGHGETAFVEGGVRKEFGELFDRVINPWEKILGMFAKDKSVQRGGCGCNKDVGAIQNYWWARDSYLRTLVRPVRAHSRYYYEHWLSLLKSSNQTAFPSNATLRFDFVEFVDGLEEHTVEKWAGEVGNSERLFPAGHYKSKDIARSDCSNFVDLQPIDSNVWDKYA